MKIDKLDTELKKLQNVMFEILLEFDRICKKHNIRYQLYAGTVLGAIRHKGFIPWDDDIDVCLLRKDYNRFIDICKTELNSKYFLQTYETDKYYVNQYAKIRKNNTLLLEDIVSDCDIHHGIFLDIFPLDNVFPNTFTRKAQKTILTILLMINWARIKKACLTRKDFMERYLSLFIHPFLKIIPKFWTDQLQTKIATMFQKQETEYVANLTFPLHMHININNMYDITEGEFNGYIFPIPKNYDKVLSRLYGDYMKLPSIEEQRGHNFIKINFNTDISNEIKFWSNRAKNYNKLEWTTKSEYLKQFLAAGQFSKNDNVLDIGTGTGIIAHLIAPHVKKVIGIDISPDMINLAKNENEKATNTEFIINDARNLKFDNQTFDKITARMAFHHITDGTEKAMQECFRVIKKGGIFILSEGVPPDKSVKERYEEIFRLKEERLTFFEEDLHELLTQAGFQVIDIQTYVQKQASLYNWLLNSGLPDKTIEQIRLLHIEADDHFKKVYNIKITEDNDVLMDWIFKIIVSIK